MRTYDPFRAMEALQRDIDRAFSAAMSNSDRNFTTAFLPGRAARAYPLLNLSADEDNLYIQALAPGLDPQSLNVTIQGNSLTIAGEKPALQGVNAETYHRNERAAGKFVRSVELPVEVDSSRIQARYQEGVLAITLPKSEAARPRQIAVAVQ
jgi:HSP20 family protein